MGIRMSYYVCFSALIDPSGCDAATTLVVVLVFILLLFVATLVAFIVIFQFLWRKVRAILHCNYAQFHFVG